MPNFASCLLADSGIADDLSHSKIEKATKHILSVDETKMTVVQVQTFYHFGGSPPTIMALKDFVEPFDFRF
jgi:hypothetical protein